MDRTARALRPAQAPADHAATASAGPAPHAHHAPATNTGVDNRKLAFWLFLSSETMFFGSLLIGYLVYRGRSLTGPTPDELFNIPLTSLSTFVLLMSSLTMVLAVNAAQRGERASARRWLLATAGLGLGFLGFQAYEYTEFIREGLTLSANLFGSSFYALTGFHGLHVAVGVLWLLSIWWHTRPGRADAAAEGGIWTEIAGLYWHFVDIVWIVIFTVVYLMEVV